LHLAIFSETLLWQTPDHKNAQQTVHSIDKVRLTITALGELR